MRSRFLLLFILILICSVTTYCKRDNYKVDVSSIDIKIQIERLEKDLFTLNPNEIESAIPSLINKYKGFLQLFSYVINTGDISDDSFGDLLERFCTDKQNNDVYSITLQLYPDLYKIEQELQEAFRHYLYYFPQKTVPSVFTCITGFNSSIITGDSVLAIGLDRYLGSDCEYYPRLGIYKYIADRMTPAYIVPDCMYAWASSEWDFESLGYPADNVLSEIIHYGKIKYFEKCMLPEENDEILFGFTSDQLKFCKNNESQMWQYLIENDLLFNTDQFIIRKLTGEAPFTTYFTNESPGKAAVWLGFRIVESYLLKNREVTINDLMPDNDIQKILEKSKYSPQ
jgi:hypothetical protein